MSIHRFRTAIASAAILLAGVLALPSSPSRAIAGEPVTHPSSCSS